MPMEQTTIEVDSLGVTVVRNTIPERPRSPWTLTESLRIRGETASGELQWGQLTGLAVDGEGSIYAIDRDRRLILAFNSSGEPKWTTAGAGEGPGELSSGRLQLFVTPEGSPVVVDIGILRIHRYDSTGRFRIDQPIDLNLGAPVAWRISNTGELFVQVKHVVRTGEIPTGTVSRIIRVGVDPDTVIAIESGGVIDLRDGPSGMQTEIFRSEPTWLISDADRLVLGLSDRYEIRVMDLLGQIERITTLSRKRQLVTDADRDEYLEVMKSGLGRQVEGQGPAALETVQRLLANVTFPTHYPHFASMELGPNGSMLLQRYPTVAELRIEQDSLTLAGIRRGSSYWDVFDSSGQFLGVQKFPSRFVPMAYHGSAILGIETDSMGIQSIVRLESERLE